MKKEKKKKIQTMLLCLVKSQGAGFTRIQSPLPWFHLGQALHFCDFTKTIVNFETPMRPDAIWVVAGYHGRLSTGFTSLTC
jgi:hypothetical protein